MKPQINIILLALICFILWEVSASNKLTKEKKFDSILLKEIQTIAQDVKQMHKEIRDISNAAKDRLPTDCSVLKINGDWRTIVKVKPPGLPMKTIRCDQFTDGGGWTVLLYRNSNYKAFRGKNLKQLRAHSRIKPNRNINSYHKMDNKNLENFNRNWTDYKRGFGDSSSEYWIGNEVISTLTKENPWEAALLLQDWNGNEAKSFWKSFRVTSEEDKFKLQVSNFDQKRSNAGDGFFYHNANSFSTYDNDNDNSANLHCANQHNGGWWFHQCHVGFLTGSHFPPSYKKQTHDRVHWMPWKKGTMLKKAVLMIRPPMFKTSN